MDFNVNERMFLGDVMRELVKAREKFPNQARATTILALVEEVGELAQAFLQNNKNLNYELECVQVATMAIRCATEGRFDNVPDIPPEPTF